MIICHSANMLSPRTCVIFFQVSHCIQMQTYTEMPLLTFRNNCLPSLYFKLSS